MTFQIVPFVKSIGSNNFLIYSSKSPFLHYHIIIIFLICKVIFDCFFIKFGYKKSRLSPR